MLAKTRDTQKTTYGNVRDENVHHERQRVTYTTLLNSLKLKNKNIHAKGQAKKLYRRKLDAVAASRASYIYDLSN